MNARSVVVGCGILLVGFALGILFSYRILAPQTAWPKLSKKDKVFFDDIMSGIASAELSVFCPAEDESPIKLDMALEMERLVSDMEGHVFESGAVFKDGSSFHALALAFKIRAHDQAGNCDIVHELLPVFAVTLSSDYLIVDFITGEASDPNITKINEYDRRKAYFNEWIVECLGFLKCYVCDIQPDPSWDIDAACIPDSK